MDMAIHLKSAWYASLAFRAITRISGDIELGLVVQVIKCYINPSLHKYTETKAVEHIGKLLGSLSNVSHLGIILQGH